MKYNCTSKALLPMIIISCGFVAPPSQATTGCPGDEAWGSESPGETPTICINNEIKKDDGGKELDEIVIDGGSISNIYDDEYGDGGRLIYMSGEGKKLTLNNVDLLYRAYKGKPGTPNQHGIVVNTGAALTINSGKYEYHLTSPDPTNFYWKISTAFGLNNGSLNLNNVEINASYNEANDILAGTTVFRLQDNSIATIANSKINTIGKLADLFFSSTLTLDHSEVSFKERISMRDSEVNVKNNSSVKSEKNTFLLYKGNNTVNITDSNVSSKKGYVFTSYGAGGVSDINISGGGQTIGAGLLIVDTTDISDKGEVIANLNMLHGANAKGEVKALGRSGKDKAIANVSLKDGAFWWGNAIAQSNSSIDIAVQDAKWRGKAVLREDTVGTPTLDVGLNKSTWEINDNSQADSLKILNNSHVKFDDPTQFITLNVKNLTGDGTGTIDMRAMEQSGQLSGDFLNISDSITGSFNVNVRESGHELRSAPNAASNDLHLIHAAGSTDGSFKFANGGVDIGAYTYYLSHNGNDDWYLTQNKPTDPIDPTDPTDPTDPVTPTDPTDPVTPTDPTDPVAPTDPTDPVAPTDPTDPVAPTDPTDPKPKPDPSESTKAVMAMANVLPSVWDSELTTLRNRMGDVRQNVASSGNVWASYLTNRSHVSSGYTAYRQNMNGLMVGGDKVYPLSDSALVLGALTSFSRSDIKFSRAGGGSVDSYSVGGYITWLTDSGYYVDTVLKNNWYLVDNNAQTLGGMGARGSYSASGLGISVEGGKTIQIGDGFIEPYLMASALNTSSANYRLSNGLEANTGRAKSLKGEVGTRAGYNWSTDNGIAMQSYIRAAVSQEFNDKNTVTINKTERFNNDMSGTTGIYGLGINTQIDKQWSTYAEVNYIKGKNMESPYNGNIGVKYSF